MSDDEIKWGPAIWDARLSISLDRPRLPVMEPVYITLLLHNGGTRAVHYNVQCEWEDFNLQLQLDGEAVAVTRFGQLMAAAVLSEGSIARVVEPGQDAVWELMVNRYFDMTTSGVYVLKVSRPIAQAPDDASSFATSTIESNELEFELTEE